MKKPRTQPDSMLWGRHPAHGPAWLKINFNPTRAQVEERKREGWTVALCNNGTHPDEEAAPGPSLAADDALPLFRKQATGPAAAELLDKARATLAPRTPPAWPLGFDDYRQRVYHYLETHCAADDMPWPGGLEIEHAMHRGILPGDYAAALIRADLARA